MVVVPASLLPYPPPMRYVTLVSDLGVQETCQYLSTSRVRYWSQVPVTELHWRQLSGVSHPPQRSPLFSTVWSDLSSGSRGREQEVPDDGRYSSAVLIAAEFSPPVIRTAAEIMQNITN